MLRRDFLCAGVSVLDQALAGWAIVWAAVVSVPPGHSSQANVIRMNMVRWSTEPTNNMHLEWGFDLFVDMMTIPSLRLEALV